MRNIISKGKQQMEIKVNNFDIAQTLECGQIFRFSKDDEGIYTIIAQDKLIRIKQLSENTLEVYNTQEQEFEDYWKNYFDLRSR